MDHDSPQMREKGSSSFLNRFNLLGSSSPQYSSLPTTPTTPSRVPSPRRNLSRRIFYLACSGIFLFGSFYGTPLGAHLTGDPRVRPPTIGIYNPVLNQRLPEFNDGCAWNYHVQKGMRDTTLSAYGWRNGPRGDLPYIITEQNQFSLDDVLTTRFSTYANRVPYPALRRQLEPDFIFFPFYSLMFKPVNGKCANPLEYWQTVAALKTELLAFIADLPDRGYPQFILPIALCRVDQNVGLLTEILMDELKDKVIVMGIETDPLFLNEGMKYTIDVPYPTRFHLPQVAEGTSWREEEPTSYFLDQQRPYLIHYAGSTHLPGQDINGVNGIELRRVLSKTILDHLAKSETTPTINITSKIIFDNFATHYPQDGFMNRVSDHALEAVFALQPPGDTPTRRGFYDSLLNGAIPVIFRKDTYDRLFPSSPDMDTELFTVFIDERELVAGVGGDVITRLEGISKEEIRTKQEHIRRIARGLQYSLPLDEVKLPLVGKTVEKFEGGKIDFGEDAFSFILKELDTIKRGKWKHRHGVLY